MAPTGPVRPPDSPYAARSDHALRASSPVGANGYALDAWCRPEQETRRYAGIVAEGRAMAGDAARVDNPHVTHARWVERVIGRHALALPRAGLGPDVGVVASSLLCGSGGVTVPMHQRGHGPGHLVDPRHAMGVVCLLAHDGARPWARVAPYTPGCGYMAHDYTALAGPFGVWPTLPGTDGRLFESADVDMSPGAVLYVDGRTLLSYGTAASWMALELLLVGRHGLIGSAADAPPVRTMSGSAVRWQARPRDVARLRGFAAP
ncbi:hypothetical protein OG948_59095 (plasmid) [Embleya sp. NBC_00888]|uniref:hypothetical protein n=1 Tax=Embleya sp. NBC_00888 TaxID=2975960 RepID=UPI003870410E|nr:hypothetical protein OG948_59095 [Embleya sp. NBC_00888]